MKLSLRILSATSCLAALVAAAGCSGAASDEGDEAVDVTSEALVARPGARLILTDSMITRLKSRASSGDAAWVALKAKCDALSTATFNAPNGTAYPSSPHVGQGYQGEGYVDPVMSLGLCYRISPDATAVTKYGAAGGRLLDAMSTPATQGGFTPSTNSGYGIRNYGVGLAFGYDWLYPALSKTSKDRAIAYMNSYVDWYDASGFLRNQPIANYFTGYLLAKSSIALATEGDNPKAPTYWNDVVTRMWGQLVKPQFTTKMAGGGWPEGWGYGPRAIRGVAEFLWIAKTAKGLNWAAELPQVNEQANYLTYFAYPSLTQMDDQGTVRSGHTLKPSATLLSELATMQRELGDAAAPTTRAFANDVVATAGHDGQPWTKMLFNDPASSSSAYTNKPLSYFAKGPNHVGMRSSWAKDATWGSFAAGTYINAADSGEQMFNEGGLTVVRGNDPVLVNATGVIPRKGGTAGENFVYDDSWGNKQRRLYNSFFVADAVNPYSPGQASHDSTQATTHIQRVDEQGGFVRSRGANIHQMYRNSPVSQFTRDVVFVRPGVFVVFDRTTTTKADADQWIAFHAPGAPTAGTTRDATQRSYNVARANGAAAGSIRTLLPRSSAVTSVALPGGVTRLEVRPAAKAAAQDWLTVVSASDTVPEQERISAADANVTSGNVVGVNVQGARNQVVLFPADHAATATTTAVRYTVSATANADHILLDMAPSSTGYAVTATASAGKITVDVRAGGSFKPSAAGSLSFQVSTTGAVSATSFTAPPASASTAPAPSTSSSTAPAPSTTTTTTTAPASEPAPSSGTVTTRNLVATDLSISSQNVSASSPEGTTYRGGDRTFAWTTSYAVMALMTFDTSAVPTTAVVSDAKLSVTVESWATGGDLRGDFLKTAWDPNTVGWAHASSAQLWAEPGIGAADVVGKPFAISGLTSAGNQRKTVSVDVAQVQAWINSPASNRGIVIDNTTNVIRRIFASESTSAADRPVLTVTYK